MHSAYMHVISLAATSTPGVRTVSCNILGAFITWWERFIIYGLYSLESLLFPPFWLIPVSLGLFAIGAPIAGRRSITSVPVRPGRELFTLYLTPVLIVAWAATFDSALDRAGEALRWQEIVIIGLLIAQLLTTLFLIVRHRRHVWRATAAGMGAAWLSASASFIAGMALRNDWL